MKLKEMNKAISYPLLVGIFYVLSSSEGNAGTMGPLSTPEKIYIGVFGGAGASTKIDISQFGTAFFTELAGGPLAVNAFGRADSSTVGFVGGHVGYQWLEKSLNLFNSLSGLTPAVELEGYYLGKNTFTGHDLNNNTERLPEHDFLVTYPMNAGVFLVNAVANFNLSNLPKFHPYIGAGIGASILSISDADATQVAPAEVGVNHYNSKPSNTDTTFAAQVKAGLSFAFNENISMFGEYRWLHLSNSSYTFGSTVFPGHAATSSWSVELGSQNYNLGAVGLRYSV
jgi:opacity protein-like surface antigen